jgi:hypothetical protein
MNPDCSRATIFRDRSDTVRRIADCFSEAPGGLEAFQPSRRYLLLDAHRLKLNQNAEVRNFAETVFRMESNQGKSDLFAVIKALAGVPRKR